MNATTPENMSETPTPRTEAATVEVQTLSNRCGLLRKSYEGPLRKYAYVDKMQELERELIAANDLIDTITTDVNYKGGLQDWIKKHDALAVSNFKLATELAEAHQTLAQKDGELRRLREALQQTGICHCESGFECQKCKALSATPPSAVVPCAWRQDADGNWNTSCGEMFCFTDGGPTENKAKFCQYCGNPVQAITYKDEEDK